VGSQLRSWERQKKKDINDFMANAKELLVNHGFADASVDIKIQKREKGIARDIVKEAEAGYSAVVLRRRGFSTLESVFIGSVANKLLSKISFIPLIITGKLSPVKKILLAIDGSESSHKMVEFVGDYLGELDYEIVLLNVIRGLKAMSLVYPDIRVSDDHFEPLRSEIRNVFIELKIKLVDFGFDPEKITEKIVTSDFSRAGAIVKEASKGAYSAIAVGRRGISKVEEFFMGRVSNKVIHSGRKHTVWVV
jgi:nucleotide-binding universal stress UspA family protein